jgi:hypothetical protein
MMDLVDFHCVNVGCLESSVYGKSVLYTCITSTLCKTIKRLAFVISPGIFVCGLVFVLNFTLQVYFYLLTIAESFSFFKLFDLVY